MASGMVALAVALGVRRSSSTCVRHGGAGWSRAASFVAARGMRDRHGAELDRVLELQNHFWRLTAEAGCEKVRQAAGKVQERSGALSIVAECGCSSCVSALSSLCHSSLAVSVELPSFRLSLSLFPPAPS